MGLSKERGLAMKKMSIEEIANYIYNEDFGAKAQTRLFKEQFGVSIGVFLTERRITHAKYLLRFSDTSIDSIAASCGFDDPNYFSRTFKHVEGISPSKFRKLWNS